MNKQKFVEHLRSPQSMSKEDFEELNQLIDNNPYFSIGRSIAARLARELGEESRGALINSAAIHATDRKHLKKFVNGDLIFLSDTPKITDKQGEKVPEPSKKESKTPEPSPPSSISSDLKPPSGSDVDQILDELQHDMEALRKSRMHFVEIQKQIEEEESSITPEREQISKEAPKKEEKPKAKGKSISFDLEALKKEFAAEETPRKEEEKTAAPTDISEDEEAEMIRKAEEELMRQVEEEQKAKAAKEKIAKEKATKKAKEEARKKEEKLKEEEKARQEKEEEEIRKAEEKLIKKTEEEAVAKATKAQAEKLEKQKEDEKAEKSKAKPASKKGDSKPQIVTNMTEAEENEEGEPGYFDEGPDPVSEKKPAKKKKLPAKADRDMRIKVKRSDLDRMMSMKSIPNPKKEAEEDTKEEETPTKPVKKTTARKKVAEKPAAKKTASKTSAKTSAKKATEEKEAKAATPKKKTTRTTTKKTTKASSTSTKDVTTAKTDASVKEEKTEKKPTRKKTSARKVSEPKIDTPKDASDVPVENPGDDPVTKATRKAMLDFGKSEGLSMSVSRASPSKRKRKRSSGGSEASDSSKGNKDDDDSGGAKSIIDRFLDENPSIKRKVLSSTKSDLSEESSNFNDELASETLADIYAKQGNIKRAELIYENLSLKFPEKKSYFAALIKKLKK